MMFILSGIRLPLQLAVEEFYERIGKGDEAVSQQAVSKARTNLNPEVIKHLFSETVHIMTGADKQALWQGKYRLVAGDGTNLALSNSEDLKHHYGCAGRGSKAVTAKCSLFYDPLNDIILDAVLAPFASSERVLAQQNIQAIEQLPLAPGVQNLYILDRGYPSYPFMSWLMDKDRKFLIRVRQDFSSICNTSSFDEDATFLFQDKEYSIRVIKVTLSSGEIEILLTNLDRSSLPAELAGELYFVRWGIETKFNSLKNKLELENMSGRRNVTFLQDFWATLYLANLLASLKWRTDAQIELNTCHKNNKHKQKTNENRLIRKLRNKFLDCMSQPDPKRRARIFDRLCAAASRYGEPVKPDRSSPRTIPREAKFHDRYKSVT
jgi:hypothetical protein